MPLKSLFYNNMSDKDIDRNIEEGSDKKVEKTPLEKKKKLIIVGVVILLLAIIISSLSIAIVKKIDSAAPKISIELTGQPDNKINISWTKKKSGTYLVEYRYELVGEIESKVVYNNTLVLERARGEFSVRVKSLGNKSKDDSSFSDWKSIKIAAYSLPLASFNLEKIDAKNVKIINFKKSSYSVGDGEKEISYYIYKDSVNEEETVLGLNEIQNREISLPDDIENFEAFIKAINYEEPIIDVVIKDFNNPLYRLFQDSDWHSSTIKMK